MFDLQVLTIQNPIFLLLADKIMKLIVPIRGWLRVILVLRSVQILSDFCGEYKELGR